ncbi:MAG: hypothetical protein ACK4ZN_04800 [Oceanibaculum sp.]|jgi:hypothetical protein
MRTRHYHGVGAPEYLAYLLSRLDGLLAAFDHIETSHRAGPLATIVARERRDEVVRLLRLQYILNWTAKYPNLHPYRQAGLPPGTPLDIDHVIPLRILARQVLAADDRAERHRCFVRAWLAPVALIARKSHVTLSDESDCGIDQGYPFRRYVDQGIEVTAFDAPIDLMAYSIADHYRLLGESRDFADLLAIN